MHQAKVLSVTHGHTFCLSQRQSNYEFTTTPPLSPSSNPKNQTSFKRSEVVKKLYISYSYIIVINILSLNGFFVCALTPLLNAWMLFLTDPSLTLLWAIMWILRWRWGISILVESTGSRNTQYMFSIESCSKIRTWEQFPRTHCLKTLTVYLYSWSE